MRSCASPRDSASSQTTERREQNEEPDPIDHPQPARLRCSLQQRPGRGGPEAASAAAAPSGAGVGGHRARARRAHLPRSDRQERRPRGRHHPGAGRRAHHRHPLRGRRDGEAGRPALHDRSAPLPGAARLGPGRPRPEPGGPRARASGVHARREAPQDGCHLAAGLRRAAQRRRRVRGPGAARPGRSGNCEAEPRVLLHPLSDRRQGGAAAGRPRQRGRPGRSGGVARHPAARPDVRRLQRRGERSHLRAAGNLGRARARRRVAARSAG